MSFYIFLGILTLICLYLGQVFGLMVYCDNCSDFKDAKSFVYIIPILRITILLSVACECIRERKWRLLFSYIMLGDKSVMILCAIIEALPELYKERKEAVANKQRKAIVKRYWRVPRWSIMELAKSVFSESREDCWAYNVKFM